MFWVSGFSPSLGWRLVMVMLFLVSQHPDSGKS